MTPHAHCLRVLEDIYQKHRGCNCKKAETSGRCSCSCNGPSQCRCTCRGCDGARLIPTDKLPDYFVLMHPHKSAPRYYDACSTKTDNYWTAKRDQAKRFASEKSAIETMERMTVDPIHVMKLPREEI